MRVRTLLLLTVCVAVASLAAPQLARGVAVTITYEIGGGTFDGPFSQGPVTGGTLVVRFPNAVSLFSAPAPASLLALTLTGPSGFFQAPNSVFYPSPESLVAGIGAEGDLAWLQCPAPDCTPQPLISGTALHTVTWAVPGLYMRAFGPAFSPRTGIIADIYGGPERPCWCYPGFGFCCMGRRGHYTQHFFTVSPTHGAEVSRTCDTPPCPARTPTPLPPLVGDVPMCNSKRGKQVTVLVPESKVQRSLDKGFFTLGECLNAANGRVLCKTKRGKRVNVLLPDSRVQGALDKGFCTLGECETE